MQGCTQVVPAGCRKSPARPAISLARIAKGRPRIVIKSMDSAAQYPGVGERREWRLPGACEVTARKPLCGLGGGPLASFIPIISIRAYAQRRKTVRPNLRLARKNPGIFCVPAHEGFGAGLRLRGRLGKCLERVRRAVPKLPARPRLRPFFGGRLQTPQRLILPIRSLPTYTECQVARPAAVRCFAIFTGEVH